MKMSFNELYTKLYRENFAELEQMRASTRKKSIGIIVLFISIFLLSMINPLFMIIGSILLFIYVIVDFRTSKGATNNKSYRQVFKEKIVGPIIENCFETAKYTPTAGMAILDYKKAGYDDDIDRYSSDDLITAALNVDGKTTTVITFAEVHTEKESKDNEGRTTYSTVFHGLAGRFILPKNTQNRIYIRTNGKVSNWNKNKVKMDMTEFEKIFDVESEDPILAMRILTADVMTEMIDLYKKYKCRFEISIIDDTAYMRLRTGPMFEPNMFKDSMEYKQLERYYLILKNLIDIASHMYDTINRLEL